MVKKSQDTITWFQFNNIFPIITSLIIVALSYGMLFTRISVLETKMDIVIEQQKQVLAKFHDIEIRYGELALKTERLETIIGKK